MFSIPDIHHVFQRHAQTDGLHDARRARLELHGRIIVDHVVFLTSLIMSPPPMKGRISAMRSALQ